MLFLRKIHILCDLCRGYLHTTCAGLSTNGVQCLKSEDRKLTYYCSDFKGKLKKSPCFESIASGTWECIDLMKNRVTPTQNANPVDREIVILKIADEERRKNIIILFNVPQMFDIGKVEQIATYVTTVTGILAGLDVPKNDFHPNELEVNTILSVTEKCP